ncbi:MAG: DUF1800 domain-containing protein [Opitutaceae bacterium]|nr:DUF1800 domain-containing protein [Opitutaceae bacterium]
MPPESLASLSPQDAWRALPAAQWDEAAARHLLQRLGFGADPAELDRARRDGPVATVQRYFARMPELPKPRLIAELEAAAPEMGRRIAGGDPQQRRLAAQDARERSREALFDLTIKWLQLAAQPAHGPAEKWLLFLSDIWVVGVQKVKNSALIYQHQDILRRHALGPAPQLAKAVSRSPAMIVYLDLQQSRRDAPNENFARELFELFTLGEGHYTENDIKQAARAFTGYRQRLGQFQFAPRQHDDGSKTVFGRKGAFDGDGVIDLVYRQPAAGTFLPKEMVRFYLSDTPLPEAYTDVLGAAWARTGHDLRELAVGFFSSRVFFAREFRGGFIKSPVHFYLGLVQDLGLSVAPLPRQVIGTLRQMGQMPFDPPNVRGWVGGRNWINSATLAARRQLINGLLQPLNENALNGDEQIELAAAYAEGVRHFTLDPARLADWARQPAAPRARLLAQRYLPEIVGTGLEHQLAAYLERGGEHGRAEAATRAALATLLESPGYQLC